MGVTKKKAETRNVRVTRIKDRSRHEFVDKVVRERPVTIFLNDSEIATFMCSPTDLESLAVGFLYTEGVLSGRGDVLSVSADGKDGVVWVRAKGKKMNIRDIVSRRLVTTGCGRGLSFQDPSANRSLRVRSNLRVDPRALKALMGEFQKRSELYKETGGVHGAALCDSSDLLVLREDIGRHNAIDKVIGHCVLEGFDMSDKILVTSGRITSEMIIKCARSNIPIVVSKSAPTDLGVSLAKSFGVTLVGFVRGSRMNVYSNVSRLTSQ